MESWSGLFRFILHLILSRRITFPVNGDDFTRYFGFTLCAGAKEEMLGVVFGAGEVAVRHSLVPSYGNDFNAFAYEVGAELPQRLKFTVAI